jgi:hypothetical protein
MPKDIDLTNKCGSCCHFKPIEDTATGECLQNPYNDSVVHDPKHPHWIVPRSRIKCPLYNAKPQTNADRIRAMSDDDMARILYDRPWCGHHCEHTGEDECLDCIARYLQRPVEEG